MSGDDVETTEAGDARAAAGDDREEGGGRDLDQQIADHLRLGLPVATLAGAVAAGMAQGAPAVILVLAGGALASVIAIFWASIRTLMGETPLSGADAYALGAPRTEEEQKRAVLRALKDLEFERSVGKISDEDYAALVAKYRTEAKRLLRILDEDAVPARRKVEALVMDRLVEVGLAKSAAEPAPEPAATRKSAKKAGKVKAAKTVEAAKAPEADAPAETAEAEPPAKAAEAEAAKPEAPAPQAEQRPACASCGTRNDADAVFCKKCGARQGASVEGSVDEVAHVQREASREEAS